LSLTFFAELWALSWSNVDVENSSYSQLLRSVWCPICGSELSVEEIERKKRLSCPKHGALNVYIDKKIAQIEVT
jgi:hypothetical protein